MSLKVESQKSFTEHHFLQSGLQSPQDTSEAHVSLKVKNPKS